MKHYGLEMEGPFFAEEVGTLPTFAAEYERRIFYVTTEKSFFGGSDTEFVRLQGVLNWTELIDTPDSFIGNSNRLVKSSATANELEFADIVQENFIHNSEFGIWSKGVMTVHGAELVQNHTFSADVLEWTGYASSLVSVAGGQDGNCLRITNTSATVGYAEQQVAGLLVGHLYTLHFWVKEIDYASVPWQVTLSGGINKVLSGTTTSGWVPVDYTFIAETTSVNIQLACNTPTLNYNIGYDIVSIQEYTQACITSDSLCADGFRKTNSLLTYREPSGPNTALGCSYSMKCVPTTINDSLIVHLKDSEKEKFVGSQITFGAWIKTTSGNNARLSITYNTGGSTPQELSSYHPGTGAWEWIELTTASTITATTNFEAAVKFVQNSGEIFISRIQIGIGTFIGTGNSRPKREFLWLEEEVDSTQLSGNSFSTLGSWQEVNLEADTNGALPNNIKSIYAKIQLRDSASSTGACGLLLSGKMPLVELRCSGLANDAIASGQGLQPCEPEGFIFYQTLASGASTLDVIEFKICGVELY